MMIDWFTVAAQVVNFLILVWLMKKFLYRPVLDAIGRREERIARERADADAEKKQAEQERREYGDKKQELESEKEKLMKQARDEAEKSRQELLEQARSDAGQLRERLKKSLDEEFDEICRAVSDRARQEIFAITRKTLADLSQESLEQRMISVFASRLRGLSGQERSRAAHAILSAAEIVARSPFDLSPQQRKDLQEALRDLAGEDRPVRYEKTPGLIGGIELATGSWKMSWSISQYLSRFETGVQKALQEHAGPKPSGPGGEAAADGA